MAKTYFATQEWVKEQIEGIKPSGGTFSGSISARAASVQNGRIVSSEINKGIELPDGTENVVDIKIGVVDPSSPDTVIAATTCIDPGTDYRTSVGISASFTHPLSDFVNIKITNEYPVNRTVLYVLTFA